MIDPTGGDDDSPLYLEPDGVNWTDAVYDAGSWSEDKAHELAASAQAEIEVVYPTEEEPTPDRTDGEDSAVDDEEVKEPFDAGDEELAGN